MTFPPCPSLPWRARRKGLLRWAAEVLHRDPAGDVWFWVCDCWTKRSAVKVAERFAREHEADPLGVLRR